MGGGGGGGGLQNFCASPRPLGFWFLGLGPGLDNSVYEEVFQNFEIYMKRFKLKNWS